MFICYIESGRNSEDALNLYFERYPERQQPSEQIFPRLENALMNYGSFVKLRPKQYAIEGRDEVEAVVIGAVLENPEISTREITVTKGVSKSRNQRILKKHEFKPYKIRLTHQLFPSDQERRMNFCNWFIRKCNENENFHRNVIWTDEARVTSNGIFNRHNRHHWSGHNEHVFQPRNMQGRFRFNIWIGIVGQRMIGPFIYDENLNAQRLEKENKDFRKLGKLVLISTEITLNQEQADLVQNHIGDVMDSTPGRSDRPLQFARTTFSGGVLWMTCANEHAKMETVRALGKVWDDADLTTVESKDLPKKPLTDFCFRDLTAVKIKNRE
ncbi:hypothetical protein NQ317_016997 [Molorchus minor]|uniref:DUF4817 domain-containing protein n=1 Tax=Molorchus minor TaxID=1323400 RepID=A0ABQ9JJU3_9CUCU|nr:hypothetical protein NQ317_016997 [Molorchus minor]